MAQATFRSGNPVMIDHTPSTGAITAGDIVLIGNTAGLTCCIAHVDIANNEKGALASGGGIYDCKVLSNYAKGVKLYADPTNLNAGLTTTSTNNSLFGYLVEATTAANTIAEVKHVPEA